MQTYLHEYFLSVYGIRTLSDFYILELLEGLSRFPVCWKYQNNVDKAKLTIMGLRCQLLRVCLVRDQLLRFVWCTGSASSLVLHPRAPRRFEP